MNAQAPILIIDDDAFLAELLAQKIAKEGFKVVTAEDGKKGLEKIGEETPSLLILDLPLPGNINGLELVKRIRLSEQIAQLPIIVLSTIEEQKAMEESLESGADIYLAKAYTTSEEIIANVKKLLRGEKPERVQEGISEEEKKKGGKGETKETIQAAQKLKAQIEKALVSPEEELSIITLVDDLIAYSFNVRTSDIHLEPYADKVIVRLRIDGMLHDSFTLPKSIHSEVITRIKVLAGMRTDEHRTAQDGRFKITIKNPPRQFDVRVSIVPTYYGENSVLRLLTEQTEITRLDDLALSDDNRRKILRAVQKPYGMILATGPTGSGKTTTLYTIIRGLNTRSVSIITIEDPIEYSLEGVDQIQVNTRTGLLFSTGLRAILRQDPNVIMVGEIRDEETANIAVNAALTGHKLLSTLHTNDAATTLPRLLDMGVEPFLVASTVNIAIGQRLVRMICTHCKTKRRITDAEFDSLKENLPADILDNHRDFFFGKGCNVCGESGYQGRIGIYEVLEMNEPIRETVMRRADAGEIKKIAVKHGMTTLLEDGFQKALSGMTTIEEILRVIHE